MHVTEWLALVPPYAAMFVAAGAWFKSRKLRKKVDWGKAATLLSTMIANKEEEQGL